MKARICLAVAAALLTLSWSASAGELFSHKDVPAECRAVPETKKVVRVVYEVKDEYYCLPSCPGLLAHWLGKCGCPECGKPRCRHRLIKREVVEECPGVKCVAEPIIPIGACPPTPWGAR